MNRYVVISDSMSAIQPRFSVVVALGLLSTQVFFFRAEFTHQYEKLRKICGLEPVKRSNHFHLSVAVDKVRSKPRRRVLY